MTRRAIFIHQCTREYMVCGFDEWSYYPFALREKFTMISKRAWLSDKTEWDFWSHYDEF